MKSVYKASDGSEHESKEAALRREKLVAAKANLEKAAEEMSRCLGNLAKTADGQWFNMERATDYWLIRQPWGREPSLVKVDLWPRQLHVDLDRSDGELVVRDWTSDRREYATYRVCDLYADERAARAAMLEIFRKAHVEMAEQVVAMEKDLAKRGIKHEPYEVWLAARRDEIKGSS